MKRIVLLFLCSLVILASSEDEHDHDHDHDLDWYEHAVFYQIYPSSFKDSNGDGRGDLKGIIANLGHLKDLGVTGAWLSPIFDSPMKDGGYDISDFKKVNPMFGTNADLEELFREARKMGLKIILDFVPNHTSDQHEWFMKSVRRESGFEDYYVWRDCPLQAGTRMLPNNWRAVFHTPAWTYNAIRNQCYLHQFTPEQPDLNYRNPKVYQEMLDVLEYWLVRGADGFRIDAINHMFETERLPDEPYVNATGDKTLYDNLNHIHTMDKDESYQFIYDARAMMDDFVERVGARDTKLMMTEAYASLANTVRWYGHNDTVKGAHMPFNFALIAGLDKDSKATDFKNATDGWLKAMPANTNANWVIGNHDRPRVGTRYGPERHESLAIMTMMLPGINVVYYGEEILMVNNFDISFEESDDPQARQTNESVYMQFSRDPVRTPFQWDDSPFAGFSNTTTKTWLPVHKDYKTNNLKKQIADEKSTFKLYQQMIKLRKANHVLATGECETKALSENVFAFTRTLKDHDSIAVFINLGAAETTVNLKELMDDGSKAKILIVNNKSAWKVGDMVGDIEKITLGAYGGLVVEVSSATKIAVSVLLIVCSFLKFIF